MKRVLLDILGRGGLWLARKVGLYRSWRIFHEMRRRDPAAAARWLEYVIVGEWPDKLLSDDFIIHYLSSCKGKTGASWPLRVADAGKDSILDVIPSETTPAERRYLYHFFRSVWDGRGHVLEVGPFLGGTTRAIALGLMDNPKRQPECRLFTADRFSMYYPKEELIKFIEPLIAKGVLSSEDRDCINQQGSFAEIFRRIHEKHGYSALVHIMEGILPDLPEQLSHPLVWLNPRNKGDYGAFFIDGCKSWFGTKFFLQRAAECAQPGAYFLFQDYGWVTCFWLPLCLGLLKEHFRLISYVDMTYTFQLVCPLDLAMIDRTIPDQPEAMDVAKMRAIFDALEAEARDRMDHYDMVILRLQQAAVLAYVGKLDEAREMIREAENLPGASSYGWQFGVSKRTPTYRPRMQDNGEVVSDLIKL